MKTRDEILIEIERLKKSLSNTVNTDVSKKMIESNISALMWAIDYNDKLYILCPIG